MRLLLIAALVFLFASPAYAQLATPNEAGLRYGHVHLNVSDIEVHKKLWVEHFGGVVVQKGSLTAVRLSGMLVALTERDPTGGSQGTVMDHFGFKVRSLPAFLAKWRAAGLPVTSEFTGAEGFPNAFVMAPDEVRVELQEDQALAVEVAAYHIHFPDTRLRGAAGLVSREPLAGAPPARKHRDDDECPGHEPQLWECAHADGRHPGPVDRSHRVRGRRPRSLLQDARGAQHRIRRPVS